MEITSYQQTPLVPSSFKKRLEQAQQESLDSKNNLKIHGVSSTLQEKFQQAPDGGGQSRQQHYQHHQQRATKDSLHYNVTPRHRNAHSNTSHYQLSHCCSGKALAAAGTKESHFMSTQPQQQVHFHQLNTSPNQSNHFDLGEQNKKKITKPQTEIMQLPKSSHQAQRQGQPLPQESPQKMPVSQQTDKRLAKTSETPQKKHSSNKKKSSRGQGPKDDTHMPVLTQRKIIINTGRTEYPLIDEVASKELNWRVIKDPNSQQDFDIWWSDLGIDNQLLSNLKLYQKVNHFPAMYQIARKTYLAKNLKRMAKQFPEHFDFFPRTWCLPTEMGELKSAQDQAYKQLRGEKTPNETKEKSRSLQSRLPVGFSMIVKPDCMSQGKGIYLSNDLERLQTQDLTVVQEYLAKPCLIDGLKFDLRVYVLVTCCDPLRIYVHKEGLVRFATQKYQPPDLVADKQNLKNLFVHLTNYALNKDNADFKQASSVDDSSSHKRTITNVYQRLEDEGRDITKLKKQVNDIIIKTLLAIQPELSHSYRTSQPSDMEQRMCFELLGFDIILQDDLKPILLEVNHAPSFATDSPLDYEVKHKLFVDMFTLLGMTIERKKQKLALMHEEKVTRIYHRLSAKQRGEKLLKVQEQMQKQSEQLEQKAGGFERVFPIPQLPQLQEQVDNLDEFCSQDEREYMQGQLQKAIDQHQLYQKMGKNNSFCQTDNTALNNKLIQKAEEQKKQTDDRSKKEAAKRERIRNIGKKNYEAYKQHVAARGEQRDCQVSPDDQLNDSDIIKYSEGDQAQMLQQMNQQAQNATKANFNMTQNQFYQLHPQQPFQQLQERAEWFKNVMEEEPLTYKKQNSSFFVSQALKPYPTRNKQVHQYQQQQHQKHLQITMTSAVAGGQQHFQFMPISARGYHLPNIQNQTLDEIHQLKQPMIKTDYKLSGVGVQPMQALVMTPQQKKFPAPAQQLQHCLATQQKIIQDYSTTGQPPQPTSVFSQTLTQPPAYQNHIIFTKSTPKQSSIAGQRHPSASHQSGGYQQQSKQLASPASQPLHQHQPQFENANQRQQAITANNSRVYPTQTASAWQSTQQQLQQQQQQVETPKQATKKVVNPSQSQQQSSSAYGGKRVIDVNFVQNQMQAQQKKDEAKAQKAQKITVLSGEQSQKGGIHLNNCNVTIINNHYYPPAAGTDSSDSKRQKAGLDTELADF